VSLEALKMISEAEQAAQRIISDTQTQIRKIKADGESEGREMIALAVSRALEKNERIIKDAEHSAEMHSGNIMELSRMECEAIKERATNRLDKAVELIVERIVVT